MILKKSLKYSLRFALLILFCLFLSLPVYAEGEDYTIGSFTKRLTLGPSVTGYVDNEHNLWTWGDNTYGQLGNGTTESSNKPVKVMSDVAQVSFGNRHAAALKTDGTLWIWGVNHDGELGTGDNENHFTPIQIMDDVKAFHLTGYNTGVVKNDGSLYLWGDNFYGQIGNGTEEDSLTPVHIMDNVREVVLGYYHTAAVTNDNDLYLWGDNEFGQLGDGTTEDHYSPTKITTDVITVSLGMDHSACVKNDGTLWVWGENEYGQLGDGTTEDKHSPEKLMDNVVNVRLGYNHSAVIKSDGNLWTWGLNNYGQLGDGTTRDSYNPIRVMSNVALVNLGHYHTGVITSGGTCYLWGDNTYGQLGNGTNETSLVPVEVFSGSIPWGVSSISITPESTQLTTLTQGRNSTTITADVEPDNYTGNIRWSVTPESAGVITGNGKTVTFTAKEEGVATIVATAGITFAKADIKISDNPIVGDVTITSPTPDSFTITAYNVQANPALDSSQNIDHVAVFCWSKPDQSDISARRLNLNSEGTYTETFTVNKNESNCFFINGDKIYVDVYASNNPQNDGNLIATGTKNWANSTESSSGHSVVYTGYSQNLGFNQKAVYDGNLAGTEGQALHLEGLRVSSLVSGVDIKVDTHLTNVGWVNDNPDGTYAGTMWQNRPIEAIRIHLTGENSANYEVQYRVHAQNLGWMDWVTTDNQAGTTGEARPIEGVQIKLVPKS